MDIISLTKAYQDDYLRGTARCKFVRRLRQQQRAGEAEAVVHWALTQLKVQVAVGENANGGPDFACCNSDGKRFTVEVTTIDDDAFRQRLRVPDPSFNRSYHVLLKGHLMKLRAVLKDKEQQLRKAKVDMPSIVVIGCSDSSASAFLGAADAVDAIGSFSERCKDNRSPISALILLWWGWKSCRLIGCRNPKASEPLPSDWLPAIPLAQITSESVSWPDDCFTECCLSF